MKKALKLITAIICTTAIVGCGLKEGEEPPVITSQVQMQTGRYGNSEPITRGQAAKMLALSKYTLSEIENMDRIIELTDTDISNWDDKYINAAVNSGLISGTEENTFLSEEYLSLEQAMFIISKFTDTLKLSYDQADRKKPVAYSMWVDAFEAAAESIGSTNIVEETLVIVADGSDAEELGQRFAMTTKGLKSIEGLDISELKFKEITVLSKDNEILAVKDITSLQPTITVAVKEVTEQGMLVNTCGCNLFFKGTGAEEGDKIDIQINNNEISEIVKKY